MNYRQEAGPPILVAAFGGRLFGLDPNTGQRLWTYEGKPSGQLVSVKLLIDGVRIYAVMSTELHILEYMTGRPIAKADIPGAATDTLMILNGRIFVGGNGALACFTLDGALLWLEEFTGMGYGAVTLGIPGYTVQADLIR